MSFRLSAAVAAALIVSSLSATALAKDRSYVREEERAGHRHFAAYHEFGNRLRIAKKVDASVIDTSDVRIHERDKMDGDVNAFIPKVGNRLRIARLIDASTVDLTGKAVVSVEPYGRPRMILMNLFGNARRLAKLLGQQ
ncbi:MAG: hypothetical protein HYR85_09025 [Planctomycetes bacterium]|nr:hypothetical protein [Planctomycetota bacterium]MBI3844737.1 hypothetical protein [Planctomycetota bacterium]